MPCIIVVGQSNAEGFAPYHSAPNWLKSNKGKLEDYAIWNRNTKTFNTYQLGVNVGSENNDDSRLGFDVFFAQKYIDSQNQTLLCLKQTMPGIPISEKGGERKARWTSHTELIPKGERSMFVELGDKLREANAYAKQCNATLELIAILFLQGEADADIPERLNDYNRNFLDLKEDLRTLVGNPDIPFINAELMYRNDQYKFVNSMYMKENKIDKQFQTVNMSQHQTSIGDNLHYDVNAHEHIGYSMFEYYLQLK